MANGITLAIRLLSPEAPSLGAIKDMIVNMVIANEREHGSVPFGRETVTALCGVYVTRACEIADGRDKGAEIKLVSGAEAEALWWQECEAGYRQGIGGAWPVADKIDPDCLSWWPEYLSYKATYTESLIRGIASTVGYIDGRRATQMRDYYLAQKAG
jgi:hypothetical protein